MAKKARKEARTAKKFHYDDIVRQQLNFAEWCMRMDKDFA